MESAAKPAAASRGAEYREKGYCVIRALVPPSKIDRILDLYQRQIVPSSRPFYRQTSGTWERNLINAHGFVQNSFLDIHDNPGFVDFSEAARDIFCSGEMQNALREITGHGAHRLVQTMLFDQNAETQPHQDRYYLDSVPSGELIAAWIALQDIDERAGRFFVLPGTHAVTFDLTATEMDSNDAYLARIRKWADPRWGELVAPPLYRGDVLFWSSGTIHGSLPTRDAVYSRRSLTAHYLPVSMEFGNRFGPFPKQPSYGFHNGMPFAHDTKTYAGWKAALWNLLRRVPILLKALDGIRRRAA